MWLQPKDLKIDDRIRRNGNFNIWRVLEILPDGSVKIVDPAGNFSTLNRMEFIMAGFMPA